MANNLRQVTSGSLQQFYSETTLTLAAGARNEIYVVYDYFRVLALTGSGLQVIFGDNQFQTPFTGAGVGLKLSDVVQRLTLVNTSGADITMTYAVAIGNVSDDRLTVSGTINTSEVSPATLPTTADVTVLTTATTQVLAANTARKEAFISNPTVNGSVLRVGDASTGAARGVEIPIGGTLVLTTTAAIFIYNPKASSIVVGLAETV